MELLKSTFVNIYGYLEIVICYALVYIHHHGLSLLLIKLMLPIYIGVMLSHHKQRLYH